MKFPGGKLKALTLSYDDGVVYDKKLVEIMKRYGLKGTFNLSSGTFPNTAGNRKLCAEEVNELYDNAGMEIALHGLFHRHLAQLPPAMMTYEIMKDRENLEALTGKLVRGMAYAYGNYSDTTVDVLKCAGIEYGRIGTPTFSFDIPTDWHRLRPTCHHGVENLMMLADTFVGYDASVENFPWRKRPQLFYLWGHSYEFNDNNNWNIIEAFGEKMANDPGIWHATNIEVYDYVEAFRNVKFSYDGSIIYNPSAQEIFFFCDGKDYSVKPGETIRI